MALAAGRRRGHLIGWWKGKPSYAAQCCPAPGSGSGSGSGASGGGERERALRIGWWKGKPAFAYACCGGTPGSGSGSGSGGGTRHLARLIGWWKGKPAWAFECCTETGLGGGSEGSYGSYGSYGSGSGSYGSGSYGSQASGSYGSSGSGSYGSGSYGSQASGSYGSGSYGSGSYGSGSSGSQGSGASGSSGSRLSGSSGSAASGSQGSSTSGSSGSRLSGSQGSGQSGSQGSGQSGSSGSSGSRVSGSSGSSGSRGSAGSGSQGSLGSGSGSSGSGSSGSGSSGSSGSGPRGSGSSGSGSSGSGSSGSGSSGSGSSGSRGSALSGSGPRGSVGSQASGSSGSSGSGYGSSGSGSGQSGRSGASGGSGRSGGGSAGSGSQESQSGGSGGVGSGGASGLTGGTSCCYPYPAIVCAAIGGAFNVIDTDGCTPCLTAAERFRFTLSGVTNGSCFNCSTLNKTWELIWQRDCWGQQGCNWVTDDGENWCFDGFFYEWVLWYGAGPGSVVNWWLALSQSCAGNPVSGAFNYYRLKAGTTFDCIGQNVFEQIGLAGAYLCANMPAEIVLTPSGTVNAGSAGSGGVDCSDNVCMVFDGTEHVGTAVLGGTTYGVRMECVYPFSGPTSYRFWIGSIGQLSDSTSTCSQITFTGHIGPYCGPVMVVVTWDASCCYGSGSGSSGSGGSGQSGVTSSCLCNSAQLQIGPVGNQGCANCNSVMQGTFTLNRQSQTAATNAGCDCYYTSTVSGNPCVGGGPSVTLYRLCYTRSTTTWTLTADMNGRTLDYTFNDGGAGDPDGTYNRVGLGVSECNMPATCTITCLAHDNAMTAPEGVGVPEDRPLPGLVQMGWNFVKAATRHVAAGLPMVDGAEKERRLAVCRECPELRSDGRCAKCGCGVKDKTSWALEGCPLNKW